MSKRCFVNPKNSLKSLAVVTTLLVSACGGSSSQTESESVQISGAVFASAVQGASVSVRDSAGNLIAGPVTSDASGLFDISIPQAFINQTIIFSATGGQFVDEAAGEQTTNTGLYSVIEANVLAEGALSVRLSPETTIIHRLVDHHGLTLAEAHQRVEEAFSYEVDMHVLPVDATHFHAEATNEQRLAGLRAAAFSQLTQDLGLDADQQFDLLDSLAADLADGEFDGQLNGVELEVADVPLGAAIQSRFAQAMMNFRAAKDQSGLNNASIGQLPFGQTAMSDSHVVRFLANDQPIYEGKTAFRFSVQDHMGNPVSGLFPAYQPKMQMAMHQHTTPYSSINESEEEEGVYEGVVYFLMASAMANGTSMGLWSLGIDLGEDEVTFYPRVNMAIGSDNVRANLKSQQTCHSGMMGASEKCSYILFKHALQQIEQGYRFEVFIAVKQSMMSFPALSAPLTVEADALDINSIQVDMSTDEETWYTAVSQGEGLWSCEELSELDSAEQATVYVRLRVNGEQATDDGSVADGISDHATFQLSSLASAGM